jgi:hypothetical protein
MSVGPNFFVYIAGGQPRDDAKLRAFAAAFGLAVVEAKMVLGAPGPRKVAAFAKLQDADMKVLELRQAGITAIVIDKDRFSRAPRLLPAIQALEDPQGLTFKFDKVPGLPDLPDLPAPKGFVRAVVLGYYTQSTTRVSALGPKAYKQTVTSTSKVQNPFIHLYLEDVHTIVDIRGPRFEFGWLQNYATLSGDLRWTRLAEELAAYYGARLDTTLFRSPDEVVPITTALNVSSVSGVGGVGSASSASYSDDTPLVLAASRVIVQTTVYGL